MSGAKSNCPARRRKKPYFASDVRIAAGDAHKIPIRAVGARFAKGPGISGIRRQRDGKAAPLQPVAVVESEIG